MSKKILFMSSAKLTALSIGLLLAVFCTIGMSFRPVYDENEAAEIVMSGPRRSHFDAQTSGSCGSTNHSYSNSTDYGRAKAIVVEGKGTVELSYETVTKGDKFANIDGSNTSTAPGNSAYVNWNSAQTGSGTTEFSKDQLAASHSLIVTFKANPEKGWVFAGWSTSISENNKYSTNKSITDTLVIGDGGVGYGSYQTSGSQQTAYTTFEGADETVYYAYFREADPVEIIMAAATGGTYTFSCDDGNGTVSSSNQNITTKYPLTLTATPASDYKFFGWYTLNWDTEEFFSNSNTVTKVFESNTTVYAKFIKTDAALFQVKEDPSITYYDLNVACEAAKTSSSKVVVPIADGTVYEGDYTIPSGVTLLIPYDDQYTLKTTEPEYTENTTTRTRYLELTLANGAKIDVNGSISVGCNKICAGSGNHMAGYIIGAYGQVNMQSGSIINMLSGSNLYCWGYIIGSGNVYAREGSKLYEAFQFDFRGGTHVQDAKQAGCLPMNQYYVQNIEAPLTIYSDVSETLYTAAYASKMAAGGNVSFVGDNGLFKLAKGAYLKRHYNSATDRIIYDVYGDAQIQSVNVSISISVLGIPTTLISMKSSDYVLPITNNMDIKIHSGTTSILYATELLAGARVVIDKDATVKLRNNLFVYDKDDYVGKNIAMNGDLNPITYSPTKTKTRTTADLTDAQIIVNGRLETYTESSYKGYLYTTTKGADICSNENGVIVLTNGEGTKTTTIQNNGVGAGEQATQNIPVTSAQLHNDETLYPSPYNYTATAGTAAGTTIEYHHGHWGWATIWVDTDGSTILHRELGQNQPQANYPYPPKSGYEFEGWITTTDNTNKETVYTATVHPLITQYTITVLSDGNGTVSGGGTFAANSVQSISATANTGYHFAHWNDGNPDNPRSINITGDVTYTATFAPNTNTAYTVKHFLQNIDGTYPSEPEETDNLTGTTGTSVTPAVKSYTGFTAPATQTAAILADGSLVITYQYTRNSYTLTWDANDGELSGDYTFDSVKYGATITAPTATRDGYDFAGWDETPAATMPAEAKTYTAQWTEEPGEYLDIVDAAANSITINMTPFPLSGWPYQVNDVVYRRTTSGEGTQCNPDRTITISHSAAPGDPLTISVKNGAGYATELSRHKYYVPFVYESDDATLSGTNSKSIVFVRNGVLTVNGEQTAKAVYVAPGAELNIAQGGTLTVEKLVLRTSPWSAAILTKAGTLNATKVYYSRQVADNSGYFQFGLPLSTTCNVNAVTLSDGSKPTYGSAWMLKSYSESLRAANGAADDPETRNNWVMLAGTQPVSGSVGYEMYSASKYYREYYFPVNISEGETVSVQHTGDDAQNSGWNVVVSPKMSVSQNAPAPEGITICMLQPDGNYDQVNPSVIMPAVPFSYQAPANGKLSFSGQSVQFKADQNAPAPRRRVAATEEPTRIQWIHLNIKNANGIGDQTSIYSHPTRYEQTYKTGIDVAKQSLTASRAVIYSSHAYGEMAFAGVADTLMESGIALTVYSPATQELTFSLRNNNWLNRMESVWLIDKETGAKIDLLSSDYSYEAAEGTTRGRFFIQGQFKAPQVATELEPTSDSSLKGREIRKVIINQKMYIIVGEQIYDGTGKLVNK